VVIQQLDGNISVGEQLDVVVELARGDGAGARLLDLGRGAGADGLVKIGCGNGQALAIGFNEDVRETWTTVISIAAPCTAGFSISVSTIDMDPPSFSVFSRKTAGCIFHAGHTVQHIVAARKTLSFLVFNCIHLDAAVRVENRGASLDSGALTARGGISRRN
jgi:hypothetical protein